MGWHGSSKGIHLLPAVPIVIYGYAFPGTWKMALKVYISTTHPKKGEIVVHDCNMGIGIR